MDEKSRNLLSEGIKAMAISLDEKQIQQLVLYLDLLNKWNDAYNLTAVRSMEEMVSKHILDSLAILPHLKNQNIHTVADVGSGAGLPGIPLAIACPQWQLTLIDSNGKKTGFLQQVKTELKLDNVQVIKGRAEAREEKFDAVVCRAFASIKDAILLTEGVRRDDTPLWAMKGKLDAGELREIPKQYMVSASHALSIPHCEGERHLLKIVKGQM